MRTKNLVVFALCLLRMENLTLFEGFFLEISNFWLLKMPRINTTLLMVSRQVKCVMVKDNRKLLDGKATVCLCLGEVHSRKSCVAHKVFSELLIQQNKMDTTLRC